MANTRSWMMGVRLPHAERKTPPGLYETHQVAAVAYIAAVPGIAEWPQIRGDKSIRCARLAA